jgi:murein DD-endopeptidase MepM/ murein hydrolase activator NlpD
MIDSHSKLPAKGEDPAAIWRRGRKGFNTFAFVAQSRLKDLAPVGVRGAQYVRAFGSRVSSTTKKLPIQAILARISSYAGDGSLLSRFALHFVIVLLALGVVTITQVTVPQVDFFLPTPTPAPGLGLRSADVAATNRSTDRTADLATTRTTELITNRGVNRLTANSASFAPALVPHTTFAERDRSGIITYTVQSGDNVWSIATGFELEPQTVLWANPKVESSPDLLSVGQKLIIPPVDGIWYTVAKGDTVESLAKKYKTTVEKIVGFAGNQIEEPYTLAAGQRIMLPDGQKQIVVPVNRYPMTRVGTAPKGAPKGSGRFAWPASGMLSQGFWAGHSGIDVASRTGVPIRAADDGYVQLAGRDTWGYGLQVVVDHGNGYMTRYAHLNDIKVKAGDFVTKGQLLGGMGCTGRCTGPHLHFEVLLNGVPRNPLGFLP